VGEPAKLLLAPTTALGGTANTIIAPEGSTGLIDPFEEEADVVTMEGIGAGQRRRITSIEPSSIGLGVTVTVDAVWTVIPDDTTVFKIVGVPVEPDLQEVGEWPKLYDSSDVSLERFGSLYKVAYSLNIIASDQELVIILYNILKAIVVSSRKYLLKNGVINAKMSGTDLTPMSEYYPQLAYSRTMSLEFEYHFDVFVTLTEAVATQLELSVTVHHPDVSAASDVEVEVSNTDVDLT
jgi:hypothetical protein